MSSLLRIDDINIELKVLECIVDGREDPSNLKLPLLELITKKFANELRIGNGGCGEVYKVNQFLMGSLSSQKV
jgi:hypothetical protein